MSPNKGPKIVKYCVLTSTVALVLITISIFPIAKKAYRWNICFNNNLSWINEEEKSTKDWHISAKKSWAVAACNGAVYKSTSKVN
tara:strand:+ start:442 stop:696 length:255 start_codon:yes stop_codon:yes gene_type:complete